MRYWCKMLDVVAATNDRNRIRKYREKVGKMAKIRTTDNG